MTLFFLLLIYSRALSLAVIETSFFCVKRLIPSIFPYMVFASFISESGLLNIVNKIPDSICSKLGICKKYLPEILLGMLCGFVSGAKLISEKYDNYSKKEATSSIFLSSVAGPGFVISFIGITLLKRIEFGIFLYITQILVSIILNKAYFKQEFQNEYKATLKKQGLIDSFCSSVFNSSHTIITICAYTIIFSTMVSIIKALFSLNNGYIIAIVSSILEISKGVEASINLSNYLVTACLIGFSVGFGGICVIFQTISVSKSNCLNKTQFIILKLLQGTFCSLLAMLYIKLTNL